jgi:hypothetical protein
MKDGYKIFLVVSVAFAVSLAIGLAIGYSISEISLHFA